MSIRGSIALLTLILPFQQAHSVGSEDLVNLAHVATEQKGAEYANIEHLTPIEQTKCIFLGMKQAAQIVKENKEQILNAVKDSYQKFRDLEPLQRRIFIAGAGTSGRLAAINAVEVQLNQAVFSTYFNIAGGVQAFVKAVEGAEDSKDLAQNDIIAQNINQKDVVIALSASGRTPYAIAFLEEAHKKGALTLSIDNSPESPLSKVAEINISNNTGPECPRGSTRMKSGTSQYETLRLYTLLLENALTTDISDLEQHFEIYTNALDAILFEIEQSLQKINLYAMILSENLVDSANKTGRIVYIGPDSTGLLGAVDGSELGPTYTWSRIGYIAPDLNKILGQEPNPLEINPEDALILLGPNQNPTTYPYTNLSNLTLNIGELVSSFKISDIPKLQNFAENLATNIVLKIITTQFAILSGWVLEGEMINLDPNNPNKKLIARRVQTLKNLKVTDNEEVALQLLEETKNDLALAVIMNRKEISYQKAKLLLLRYNGNVVRALRD